MSDKLTVELGNVQKTLLLPLWGRAVETQKTKPLLIDKTALEIINKIDFDFSKFTNNITELSKMGWVIRSLYIDRIIEQFLIKHPKATIVNIGCGLDTTFERIDNGKLYWYDLDLPDVIELRKQFIQENDRRKFIARSFLDYEWLDQLKIEDNILFIAAGVFYYFDEHQIIDFFNKTTEHFSYVEFVFDASSPLGIKIANKMVIKSSGMDEKSFLKWGLKRAKDLQLLNNKMEIVDECVFFKNYKKLLSLKNRTSAIIYDFLRISYMVHLKIIN